MHAVYNYSGLVDIAEVLTKLKRMQAEPDARKCAGETDRTPSGKESRGLQSKPGRG